MKPKERCRHNRSWLIVGAHAEWCYECGAWRKLRQMPPNSVAPASRWFKPVGKGGENPSLRYKV